ncbi:MAG TPA: hypothetical protein VFY20_05380 [Gemmatimonadales bacterium]|nr:hypothetical protein [Gemmatimonadales bacterium]
MTIPSIRPAPEGAAADPFSPLALAALLLRRRRSIITLMIVGGVIGLLSGLLRARTYRSAATFLPQSNELGAGAAGLALAASQFGVKLPQLGGTWGPQVYVALLRSHALLADLATDTVVVVEEEGRRVMLMDLLKIKGRSEAERIDRAVLALRKKIETREIKQISGVEVAVVTKWPSVSHAVAERLVGEVHHFVQVTRQSQASAERKFAEARAEEAKQALRSSENRLQSFLQRNRVYTGSPELTFERERLQREVSLNQNIYNSMLQAREEARLREVRDTPVITELETPEVPVLPQPRRSILKGAAGMLAGGLLALVLALLADGVAGARRLPSDEAREFLRLVDEAVPRVLRRRMS